jgi:hypothetical protein
MLLPALLAAAGAASGDAIALRVEFDAPEGCSGDDAFYEGVLSRMPRARRASAGEDAVRLGVRLTRVGKKVRGELRLLDARGESDTRTVEGATCDEVVEVLSLTASLALTLKPARPPPAPPPRPATPPAAARAPSSAGAASGGASAGSSSASSAPAASGTPTPATPPAEPAPEPPSPPEPPPPEPAPAEVLRVKPELPEDATQRRYRIAVGVRGVAAGVVTPSVSFGGSVDLRLAKQDADGVGPSLGVSGFYVPNDFLRTADDARLRWMALAVTGCPGWKAGRAASVEPCAQVMGGWIDATGLGVTNPRSAGRSWWSVGALLRVAARLGWGFSLELDAGVAVPLVERRFITTTPERTVGETPTIAPMAAVGVTHVF